MTISQITKQMTAHAAEISKKLNLPSDIIQSWIDEPTLILDLGIIEIGRISLCIGIELKTFIDTFDRELPKEAWE